MSDDKTEEATPKKKSDARKKGQIAKSKDVGIALTTIATLLVILAFSEKIINKFKAMIIYYLSNLSLIELTEGTLKAITMNSFTNFAFPFSTNSATSFILDIIKTSCYFLSSDSNHFIHLHSFCRFSLFLLCCTNLAFSVSSYIFHTIIIQTK